MPPSDGFSRSGTAPDATYPLEVLMCEGCGLAQLRHTVAPDALFGNDYFYFSSYTQTVLDNARSNVEAALARFRPGPDALVVELRATTATCSSRWRRAASACSASTRRRTRSKRRGRPASRRSTPSSPR